MQLRKNNLLAIIILIISIVLLSGCVNSCDSQRTGKGETSVSEKIKRVPINVWGKLYHAHIFETGENAEDIDWSLLEPAVEMARGYNINVLCRKIDNIYYIYYLSHFNDGKVLVDELWISKSSWDNAILHLSRDEFPSVFLELSGKI